jgi:hypothetical protein
MDLRMELRMELRMWAEGAWLSLVSPLGGPLLRLVLQFEGAWLSLWWAQLGTPWLRLNWAQVEWAWLSMVSQFEGA